MRENNNELVDSHSGKLAELHSNKRPLRLSAHMLEIVLLALIVVLSFTAENFFTAGNFLNILRSVSMQGIIAMGMTMVIISGEIDLSVGSVVAFCCMVGSTVVFQLGKIGVNSGVSVAISSVTVLVMGWFIGFGESFFVTHFKLPSFIVTLATMTIFRGLAMLTTGGFALTPYEKWFAFWGSGYLGDVFPVPTIFFLAVTAVIWWIMQATPFGRSVYAVGSNMESARLSGIDVARVKRIAMATTTMLAAGSSILLCSLVLSGLPTAASGWEMNIISAVVIGGASLSGGEGNVRGTLLGILFWGILTNGMTLLGMNENWQNVMKGVLILLAVLFNQFTKRKRLG